MMVDLQPKGFINEILLLLKSLTHIDVFQSSYLWWEKEKNQNHL